LSYGVAVMLFEAICLLRLIRSTIMIIPRVTTVVTGFPTAGNINIFDKTVPL
jgi:hypothetical protein